jgi:hypothetical protein
VREILRRTERRSQLDEYPVLDVVVGAITELGPARLPRTSPGMARIVTARLWNQVGLLFEIDEQGRIRSRSSTNWLSR